jgi:hypothetical protein
MGREPGALEVWVLKHGAATQYEEVAKAEAATAVDDFRDVSGRGFRAYQTSYDTAALQHGVPVTVQLTLPNELGQVAMLPAAQEENLLGRLRAAILSSLH